MSFKDAPFKARYGKGGMGDMAEHVFERVYPEGYVRYGINRPPINLTNVPAFVRYTPDYLTAKGLVEVQGFGKDQTFKLKRDKLDALQEWAYIGGEFEPFDVHFFVYDSSHREYAWIELTSLVVNGANTEAFFPEGKLYYGWHKSVLPTDTGWHDAGA